MEAIAGSGGRRLTGARRRPQRQRRRATDRTEVTGRGGDDLGELQLFIVQLGAAMNAAGEPVYVVQDRLTKMAAAYGAPAATVSAFPTYLMVTMGRGEPAVVEITTPLASSPRLDQIAALDHLLHDAERGAVHPTDGLRRLAEIRQLHPRFGRLQSIAGYSVLTIGLCLILHPAARDVAAAAVFGALVGVLRSIGRSQPTLQVLMPVIAAFSVSALSALAVKEDLIEPGMRAMVAVARRVPARRDVDHRRARARRRADGVRRQPARVGIVQLALLSFGILAGIEAVGIPSSQVLFGRQELLGAWSPWLGVLVFAVGVIVANSAPPRSFPALLVVLYPAWTAQFFTNAAPRGLRERADRRDRHDGRLGRRGPVPVGHARPRLVPARVLAARPRCARADRSDRAGRRRRRPGPRGHRRLHLRDRPRRAVRYAAHRLGRRDSSIRAVS